uniref:Uncharacterized protein n=1 Tax=Anguilla anguilla TaxID=7936 RepID=A0A0E9S0L8_ANGAN
MAPSLSAVVSEFIRESRSSENDGALFPASSVFFSPNLRKRRKAI